jgi:hypothetical protein
MSLMLANGHLPLDISPHTGTTWVAMGISQAVAEWTVASKIVEKDVVLIV